ncbi:MAG: hypothetical protein NC489_42170 [Ruminococcus flavefaciens]|nr:hypothetical protein [Ruminococcus flavefaciens]
MGKGYINSTWEEQRNRRIIFPVMIECPPVHMEFIHPLKQKLVYDIHQALVDDARVRTILMFGSSVNLRCTIYSDADLAVRLSDDCITKEVKNEVSEIIQKAADWNADILWYDSLDRSERIYGDILKGVQIL